MENNEFAKRLTAAIKASGVKKIELAKRIGVNPSNITRYTQGKYEPDLDMVKKLADVLNVSPVWLAGLGTNSSPEEVNIKDLTWNKIEKYLGNMDEKDMTKVLHFIEDYILK